MIFFFFFNSQYYKKVGWEKTWTHTFKMFSHAKVILVYSESLLFTMMCFRRATSYVYIIWDSVSTTFSHNNTVLRHPRQCHTTPALSDIYPPSHFLHLDIFCNFLWYTFTEVPEENDFLPCTYFPHLLYPKHLHDSTGRTWLNKTTKANKRKSLR